MLDRIRALRERLAGAPEEPTPALTPLGLVTAQMLLVTGVGSTVELLARRARARDMATEAPHPLVLALAPALVAPLAAAAHVARARRPGRDTETASRVLDSASIGAGIAGTLASLGRGDLPSLAPLALASAGTLGLVLSRHERRAARERARLERRASVVERLVPARRRKLDRIVVHV